MRQARATRRAEEFEDRLTEYVAGGDVERRISEAAWSTRAPREYRPSQVALEACPETGRRGEPKQVTVLFADVQGSMELAERVDPEERLVRWGATGHAARLGTPNGRRRVTAPAERKLAAILAADVVGYSRLMAADEEGTVARLRQYRGVVDGSSSSRPVSPTPT